MLPNTVYLSRWVMRLTGVHWAAMLWTIVPFFKKGQWVAFWKKSFGQNSFEFTFIWKPRAVVATSQTLGGWMCRWLTCQSLRPTSSVREDQTLTLRSGVLSGNNRKKTLHWTTPSQTLEIESEKGTVKKIIIFMVAEYKQDLAEPASLGTN